MNTDTKLCSSLLDELNDIFALKSISPYGHYVVSNHRSAVLVSESEIALKNRLLGALKHCFIDSQNMRLRECELSLFCANEGFEIVTVHESYNRVCFYLRADVFDVVVEHEI